MKKLQLLTVVCLAAAVELTFFGSTIAWSQEKSPPNVQPAPTRDLNFCIREYDTCVQSAEDALLNCVACERNDSTRDRCNKAYNGELGACERRLRECILGL